MGPVGSTQTTRSRSPTSSASSRTPDGATVSRRSRPGTSRRCRRITSTRWWTATASIVPNRTTPARPVRCASAHRARSRVSATTRRAWASTSVACGLGRVWRPWRSKRGTPTRRSNSARPWVRADGVTPSEAAAAARVGDPAAATRYSNCCTVRLGRIGSSIKGGSCSILQSF